MVRLVGVFAVLSLSLGCMSGGDPLQGFARTVPGDGPMIAWDLDAKPLPEIPLPNDVATRTDPTSPTGRRVNASLEAPTAFERKLRVHMSQLDGFGTFAPVWIKFDPADAERPHKARLDLLKIAAAHRGDTVFDDDLVFMVNVTKGSPTYGEAQLLDFGNGSFPITLEDTDEFFENDPRSLASNLLFDTYDEDLDGDGYFDVWEDTNQNGVLDPGEDVDGDGRLDISEDTDSDGNFDVPNLWGTITGDPEQLDPFDDLISFYELESDTLWFRPVVPLEQKTTYALFFTKGLTNEDGDPVQSPFEYVHHLQQIEALRPLFEDGLLQKYGLGTDDVAFAWTFTTQSTTGDLVALREGINGIGPYAHLAEEYPARVDALIPMSESPPPEQYKLRVESVVSAIDLIFENIDVAGLDITAIQPVLDTYGAVDYVIAGDYTSPNFLEGGGGVFDIDSTAGTGTKVPESIRFLMVVPKEQFGSRPFPVALYCHGYTSMKLEALAFAGVFAKYGIATFVIDAVSHGLPLGPEFDVLLQRVIDQFDGEGLLPFYNAVKKDRAKDLNADSFVEVGGDFWTNDLFHTRDMVRQTLVDYMQASRMVRGFDGVQTWDVDVNGDGLANDLAGDFDGDGVVDVGGPDNKMYALGTSMGGIHSSILATLEPPVVAAAPISPGGGLLEVGLRTDLGNVLRAVILPILGPMLITEPHPSIPDLIQVKWLVNNVFGKETIPIANVGDFEGITIVNQLRPGDIFTVHNETNDERDEVIVDPQRRVRAHIAADINDRVVIEISRPDGTLLKRIDTFELEIEEGFQGREYPSGSPLRAIQVGLGFRRNTPSLRRLIGIAQTVLEPADPVNYAPHYSNPLDIRPEGPRQTNVLFTVTLGDMTVPVSTGVALARAAGVIGYREPDPRYGISQNQLLIDHHVVEAVDELFYFQDDCCHSHCGQVNFDIDDLSRGLHDADLPRLDTLVPDIDCGPQDEDPTCAVRCQAFEPLRAWAPNGDNGINAVRFPALNPRGQHAIDVPNPNKPFDASMFVLNQIGLFLSSDGTVLSDHPCLAKNDCTTCVGDECPLIPPPTRVDPLMP